MSIIHEQDGVVIVESNRAILNVKHMSDGTDRLEGVFDLDNRRCYMFTEEELGRDVFVAIDNTADRYADAWVNPNCPWYEPRFPSNYVLHDYAKHHDLKLKIKFMNERRYKQYGDIVTAIPAYSCSYSYNSYSRYNKIVTRWYAGGAEIRRNWYWVESDYTWTLSGINTYYSSMYLARCNGKNAVALTIDEWFNDKYQDIARYCDTVIIATNGAASRICTEALERLIPASFTTKIDYTQFSKALETMPDFLKKPYNKSDNLKEAFKMEYKYHRIPQIKNVIIAEPYTTILWSDNTKTQVKCMDGDRFDPEHGFAMCVLKKIYEEPKKANAYSKWLKGWVKKGVENGEKQKKKKQKKEKEECEECCDLSSFFDGN